MNIERMKRNISMIFLLYIFLLCSSILSFSLGSVTGFFFSGFFRRIYYIGKKKDWSLKVWDYVENEESEIVPVILRCESLLLRPARLHRIEHRSPKWRKLLRFPVYSRRGEKCGRSSLP